MGLISRLGAMIEFRHAVQDLKKAAKHEGEEGYQEKISGILSRIDHASSQLGDPQKYRLGGQRFMLWNDYQKLNDEMRDIADDVFKIPDDTTKEIAAHLTSMQEALDDLRDAANGAAKPGADPKSVFEQGKSAISNYETSINAINQIRSGKGLTRKEAKFVAKNEFDKLKENFQSIAYEMGIIGGQEKEDILTSLNENLAQLPEDDQNVKNETIEIMWDIDSAIARAEEGHTSYDPQFKGQIESIGRRYSEWKRSHPKHMKLYNQGQAELKGFDAKAELAAIHKALEFLPENTDDSTLDEIAVQTIQAIEVHLKNLTNAGKGTAFQGDDKERYEAWVRDHPKHAAEATKRRV